MDLNKDGNPDILSGTYAMGGLGQMAGLFQVLWGRPGGGFKAAKTLNGSDGKPLYIKESDRDKITKSICTRPFATDWDSDGDLDIVTGNFEGTFYLFEGEGKAKFQPEPSLLRTVGGEILRIPGAHSDPMIVDMDGDGDLDIVSGSTDGQVHWSENVSKDDGKPKLEPFRVLIENKFAREFQQTQIRRPKEFEPITPRDLQGPAGSTRVWVADINGDTKLDVLAGDQVTLVSPLKGDDLAKARERFGKWQKQFNEIAQALPKADRTSPEYGEISRRFSEVYQLKSKAIDEKKTGLVWLYLQK